jgi:hypothetical protein
MDTQSKRAIEDYVRSFEKVANIIETENPDCIVAPMFGAVPFIDVLNIINPQFPNDKVEYVPASSNVHRVKEVLRGTFGNLINAYAPNGGKFLALDEVVSGSSLEKVHKQFTNARHKYAERAVLETFGKDADFRSEAVQTYIRQVKETIQYNSIGILETGRKIPRNPQFQTLLDQGVVIPVETYCILTMDRADFFPAKYRAVKDSEKRTALLPVVDRFNVAPAYIDFLTQVAQVIGANPADVTMHNMGKIQSSYHWVPEELRTLQSAKSSTP